MSIIPGINTVLSSLLAHQQALDITGQNIANVDTPGYHRQEAVLGARASRLDNGSGSILGGVDVLDIRRADTSYIDLQIRFAASKFGQFSAASQQLAAVEGILNPSGTEDLGAILNQFWNSWQALAASPDQTAPRLTVQQAASELASWLNDRHSQLLALQSSNYEAIETSVAEINRLAAEVAELNTRIARSGPTASPPGELVDQRQQALERLAELGGVVALKPEAEGAIITLNGHPLVQGGHSFAVEVEQAPDGTVLLTWADTGREINPEGGELAGLISIRDERIPEYLQALDNLASQMINAVNAEHQLGVGLNGATGSFFVGAGAADIRLADPIANDPNAIAAGSAGLPGDGSIAAAINALRDQPIISGQTTSEFAAAFTARIGEDLNTARQEQAIADAIQQQMVAQQQSIGGVSLDEEMTRMMEYQRAYSAAARVLTTMDQMVGELLEIIG